MIDPRYIIPPGTLGGKVPFVVEDDAWAQPSQPPMLEVVPESEGSAPRTSEPDRNDEPEEPPRPTLAELRARGARNRRKIEIADEERFYLELDQAKVLCIARDPRPEGLGLRSDAYAKFSAELGYPGKAGKMLPRLFNPYGEKVVAWVQDEQEKAQARREKYDFPSWRKALKEMQKQWEEKRNSHTDEPDEDGEEEVDPAEVLARHKSELDAKDERIKAAEQLARSAEQNAKSLRADKEDLTDKLAAAEAKIAELEAELAEAKGKKSEKPQKKRSRPPGKKEPTLADKIKAAWTGDDFDIEELAKLVPMEASASSDQWGSFIEALDPVWIRFGLSLSDVPSIVLNEGDLPIAWPEHSNSVIVRRDGKVIRLRPEATDENGGGTFPEDSNPPG